MTNKRSSITRRNALGLLLAGAATAVPSLATADTESDLASAQARLAEAQAELDAIAGEYEELSAAQSQTLDEIERIQREIDKLERRIERTEKKLKVKQKELSKAVSEEYKDGNAGVVDLLLKSKSIEDVISNLYCYEKVTEQQANLIQDVKDTRERYIADKCDLEAQQVILEETRAQQEQQLEAMRDKQLEAQQLIDSLDKEVKDLIAKRDAELLAAQQEAERARKEREAAAAAAAEAEREAAATQGSEGNTQDLDETSDDTPAEGDSESGFGSEAESSDEPATSSSAGTGSGSAAKVVEACHNTPSPGLGLCAGWCSNVMINAGYGFVPGNANDMYAEFCFSSDRSELQTGMAVAVSSHPHTSAGRIYGHIGMYVGGGMMMDNIGYIRTISVDDWTEFYGATVTPRWGWLNGIVLS